MPLTNDYERAAMLLLRAAADGAVSLAGTGFAVMVDSETFGTELRHFYLVTAGHVVLGTQPVYARFRLIGGSIRDERIDHFHRSAPEPGADGRSGSSDGEIWDRRTDVAAEHPR
jgi:hypothetical protein